MISVDGKYMIFGGMQPNANTFEIYQEHWEPLEGITFEDDTLKDLFDSGLKGFNTANTIIKVGNHSSLN